MTAQGNTVTDEKVIAVLSLSNSAATAKRTPGRLPLVNRRRNDWRRCTLSKRIGFSPPQGLSNEHKPP